MDAPIILLDARLPKLFINWGIAIPARRRFSQSFISICSPIALPYARSPKFFTNWGMPNPISQTSHPIFLFEEQHTDRDWNKAPKKNGHTKSHYISYLKSSNSKKWNGPKRLNHIRPCISPSNSHRCFCKINP